MRRPFTVSVDLNSKDTSTGISTSDRSLTIRALADPNTEPNDLGRPGHIFPLKAKEGGCSKKSGAYRGGNRFLPAWQD